MAAGSHASKLKMEMFSQTKLLTYSLGDVHSQRIIINECGTHVATGLSLQQIVNF